MSGMVFVTDDQLASFLGVPLTETLTLIAELTNELVEDEWDNPVNPPPASVRIVAFNVAVRAGSNPKGLTSWTRSWDDITRTERVEGARRMGIYLTDDEKTDLNGTPVAETVAVRSIPLNVPGLNMSRGLGF